MGFFNKLKQNFKHGGVKLQLSAPSDISIETTALPVTVTITATEPQTIRQVSVQILATNRNQSFSATPDRNMNTTPVTTQPVARLDNNEVFTIQPGETKTVNFNLTMNLGAAITQQFGSGGGLGAIAGALQKIETTAEALNVSNYEYSIEATAKVDGITFSPAVRRALGIRRPGDIGKTINL